MPFAVEHPYFHPAHRSGVHRSWWAVGALLLAVMMAAPGAAQGGPSQMSLEADETTVSGTTEEPASVTLTVSRSGTTGTPLDQAVDEVLVFFAAADIEVSVGTIPEGWTVAIDPSGFALAPGESQTIAVEINVGPDGPEAAELTFTAHLTSPDPTGMLVEDEERSIAITVTRDDDATRKLLEAIGPGIWALLGALLVAIIIAIYLFVDSRSRVVEFTKLVEDVAVAPGETVSVPFRVANHGKETDRFSLTPSCGDPEWKAVVPVAAVTLDPGREEELHIAVTASKKVPPGSRAVIRIVAVPDRAPKRTAVMAFSTYAQNRGD